MVCEWLSHMHRWALYCHLYVFLGFSNNSINVLFVIPHLAHPMKGGRHCTWVVVIIRSQPIFQYMPNKYSEVRLTAWPNPTIPESIARRISPLMILFWKLKSNKLGIQLGGTSYVPTQHWIPGHRRRWSQWRSENVNLFLHWNKDWVFKVPIGSVSHKISIAISWSIKLNIWGSKTYKSLDIRGNKEYKEISERTSIWLQLTLQVNI